MNRSDAISICIAGMLFCCVWLAMVCSDALNRWFIDRVRLFWIRYHVRVSIRFLASWGFVPVPMHMSKPLGFSLCMSSR